MLNTFLYSVYGSVTVAQRKHPALLAYRHRWFDALFTTQPIEAVVTLGTLAAEAWQLWAATSTRASHILSPRPPSPIRRSQRVRSKGDKTKLAAALKAMLKNWNTGLRTAPAVQHPDQAIPLVLYGDTFVEGDRVGIPAADYPAGLPAWMHEQDGWARRVGTDDRKKRANITITVPKGELCHETGAANGHTRGCAPAD